MKEVLTALALASVTKNEVFPETSRVVSNERPESSREIASACFRP